MCVIFIWIAANIYKGEKDMLKIGSHVGMSGKEMLLGSAKEAKSYDANVFMVYTGAPQNTRRKDVSELRIDEAHEYMKNNGIEDIIIHAPYIIRTKQCNGKSCNGITSGCSCRCRNRGGNRTDCKRD